MQACAVSLAPTVLMCTKFMCTSLCAWEKSSSLRFQSPESEPLIPYLLQCSTHYDKHTDIHIQAPGHHKVCFMYVGASVHCTPAYDLATAVLRSKKNLVALKRPPKTRTRDRGV
uniref:Uncharacterized protein n=1 Tax=Eutreptiella gymnastica TaxID=73025 RepID=A0A7S1IYD1_9EUGL|mmetsp:Transcript_53214/g.95041  ORF Transcript_53214/g.95041 Transcript_53214/m.95041 type:complete len:114 (+) Transcript_53214:257-598(+)